ncbi:MAG: hypothetical protein GFH27_549287n294 [Chloroflexi bacterium AL-W]|nr:hypothetical protein [Chloroflexi bacterium AL-N1]NOK66568.1 hypothetical protein [Chloroflexi bacterium AL-N10]NOK71956.1 hypothetical protein [Chloroflexi bacterium AL-N5]NOK81213.1 hypothetical protein [Chloroflexi bacterium AL-W]NOK89486.1 hypothetical protein [Chloroflexi bacterium AL-N15]
MYHRVNVLWQGIDGWIRWTLVGLGAPILALALVYWGYCWHWWGRDTLALQYLFQCRCPPASEATRYPNFTVLVSACDGPFIRDMAPSGRFLFIEAQGNENQLRHIDLQTKQVHPLPLDYSTRYSVRYIDDQRLFIYHVDRVEYSVLDLQNGSQTVIPWIYADAYDLQVYNLFHRATEVLFFNNETLALTKDFHTARNENLILLDTGTNAQEVLSNQLAIADIEYQSITPPYQTGPIWDAYYSPDGRFYAQHDGIYRSATREQLIRTNLPFFDSIGDYNPVGWIAEQRGVVYMAGTACVIDNRDDYAIPYNWFPVPQPILLLELPEEF